MTAAPRMKSIEVPLYHIKGPILASKCVPNL